MTIIKKFSGRVQTGFSKARGGVSPSGMASSQRVKFSKQNTFERKWKFPLLLREHPFRRERGENRRLLIKEDVRREGGGFFPFFFLCPFQKRTLYKIRVSPSE